MTVILGIDPGSHITGYAAIKQDGRQFSVISSGTIILPNKAELSTRLAVLQREIEKIIEEVTPQMMAVEDIFTAHNVRSALALGHARGIILAAAGKFFVSVTSYPPATVKKAICGHGRAEKAQVQQMMQMMLNLAELPKTDEADAMAIALCHALAGRGMALRAASQKIKKAVSTPNANTESTR